MDDDARSDNLPAGAAASPVVATDPTTDPATAAAIHEQNVALLAEVAELEHELDAKRREVEKLGSRVTNLELDVQRRDAVIERLRAEQPGEPPGLMPEAHREDWWRAELARLTKERDDLESKRVAWEDARRKGFLDAGNPEVARVITERANALQEIAKLTRERDEARRDVGEVSVGHGVSLARKLEELRVTLAHVEGERDVLNEELRESYENSARLTKERDNAVDNYEHSSRERDEYRAEVQRLQSADSAASVVQPTPTCPLPHVMRQRLPDDRQGRTYKLRIGTKEDLCEACGAPLPGSRVSGHLTVNAYPDGRPGELFLALDRARRGDLAATMGHQLAIAISIALQHGVPLEVFTSRMRHVRDESGGTVMCDDGNGKLVPAGNPRTVGSLVDLIAATLERHAGGGQS